MFVLSEINKNKMKKVELEFEWNWKAQMNSIIKLLEMGDSEGKKYARKELLELAEKLDNYNAATTHGFLSTREPINKDG